MEFKEWFCLSQRESFTIDAKINPSDAQFYFGRPVSLERMRKQIARSFVDPQVPKMMVWGPYGSGKTQTLYHLAYWLKNSKPDACRWVPYTVHLDIEMQSRSTAASWHLQNMEAIGMQTVQGWLQRLYSNSANFDQDVDELTEDFNIAMAFKQLRGGGEIGFTTWRWLSGQKLTAKELQEIKVTRNLGEVGVGDMVLAIQASGALAKAVGTCLILLVDEMEELLNVREGDAAESWHQYLRKLSDNANSTVGLVVGFKADTKDEAPRILIRGDVERRFGKHNYIELEPLAAPANVRQFVEEMLAQLVVQPEADKRIQQQGLPSTLQTYPFTAEAFELLCEYACQDPVKATPGNIIKTINECAIAAWDAGQQVIDQPIVDEIAPIVFE